MSDFHVLIPKLGESIQEATITKLFVKQGDTVVEDDILFEIATDKVDSEIPSPVAGIIKEIRCAENDLIPVGQVVIIITLDDGEPSLPAPEPEVAPIPEVAPKTEVAAEAISVPEIQSPQVSQNEEFKNAGRFYSPLVKSIATKEGVSLIELDSITGEWPGRESAEK